MGAAHLFSFALFLTRSVVEGHSHMRDERQQRKGSMDCGEHVTLCGVLSLDTGTGRGVYRHPQPSVHGLWPETGRWGDSRCGKPRRSSESAHRIFPCYRRHKVAQNAGSLVEGNIQPRRIIAFQSHEWDKHGKCAGVKDAKDYFTQVCELSDMPLALMLEATKGGGDFVDVVGALQAGGFAVWDSNPHEGEIRLSACANHDGKWQLAAPADFDSVCGSEAGTTTLLPDNTDAIDDLADGVTSTTRSPDPDGLDSLDGADDQGSTQKATTVSSSRNNYIDDSDQDEPTGKHQSLQKDLTDVNTIDDDSVTPPHPVASKSKSAAVEGLGSQTEEEKEYDRNHSLRRSLLDDDSEGEDDEAAL